MPSTFDEIGYWSEIKLDIIREYAKAYSHILTSKRLYHVYIDAFAGSGTYISRTTGSQVLGSPLVALAINPPFREYYFIDIDGAKVAELREKVGNRSDVHILQGDCNKVLLQEVFPKVNYGDFRRGLCLLDPYGLHLDWKVISRAGEMKSIDMLLNFPVMDMNRNVLWRKPRGVDPAQIERMNTFWGDDSWERSAYRYALNLFGEKIEEKEPNAAIAAAFRERLRRVAGFRHVPTPMPMRNSIGNIVYYLFFASQKPVAAGIMKHIFDKYRGRGVR